MRGFFADPNWRTSGHDQKIHLRSQETNLHSSYWFADAPVVLDFEDTHVEVNHWKCDELSVTFNSIDVHQPVRWPGTSFHLAWRNDAHPGLAPLTGERLIQAELLQWIGADLADDTVAVGFEFGSTR